MVIVSVVIPTCGRPDLLQRAVRSALAQTLRAIEVVVVIDGEDPGTRLAMERVAYQDPRLHVLALPKSVGGSDARNRGVDAAAGEWIAFLDDDDEWFPGKLQAQLDAVAPSTAPIVIGTCRMIARTPAETMCGQDACPPAMNRLASTFWRDARSPAAKGISRHRPSLFDARSCWRSRLRAAS